MFLSKLSLVLCIFAFGQINAQSYNFPKLNLTVSWTVNKNTTKFTLVHNKTDFSNRWIAVGINTKEEMNGGNALICFFDNSTGNWVGHYHLDGATPKLFDESKPGFGIKNSSVTDLGKEAICTFERENYLDRDRYLDSVQDLFVLAAMSKGRLQYHRENRGHTARAVSLKLPQEDLTTTATTTTATTTTASTLKKTDGGFSSDGWHYFPSLNMVVYWLLDEKKTKFIVEFDKPSDFVSGWFAVGFNTQSKMSGGNGVVCVVNNNSDYSVHSYHFDGYTPKYFSESDKSWGLSDASVVHEGSLVGCTFYRENVMNSSKYVSTDQELYLLASYGFGSFGFHGLNKALSEKMYSLVHQSTDMPELPFDWSDLLNVETLERLRTAINQFVDQIINYLKLLNLKDALDFFNF